ncbi:hypothetical protein C8J57DRAFT_1468919 [Mycena rebaudengoi]|nr:hypothetical protein C8J57DRAFT_1468919 [Mycena rebaudengoi]
MLSTIFHVACLSVAALATSAPVFPYSAVVRIRHDDALLFYYGRCDTAPETRWSGSGFKITVQDLSSLTLNVGPNTTFPLVALGVSVNYAPFFKFNASARATVIPVDKKQPGATTVRARLVPYKPSKSAFEFIGNSFSTRYTTRDGILDAWDILIDETFKGEETVVAQPGATLVYQDMASFGNIHGVSFQFFHVCTSCTSISFPKKTRWWTKWNGID